MSVNPNVGEQIIAVIEALCEKFGIVFDWTAENIWPEVQKLADKLVNWEIATSWMWIGVAAILFLASLSFLIVAHVKYRKDCWDGEGLVWAWVIFIFSAIIFLIVAGVQVYDIITCKVFPEKFIYEYINMLLTMR